MNPDQMRRDRTPKTRLQAARRASGMTQKRLAEAAGVSLRSMQDLEQGRADIGKTAAETVRALARALGLEMEQIMED